MDSKEKQIMDYLKSNVFNPILESDRASSSLKQGVRLTMRRLKERNATGMLSYYWSAIIGTEKSTRFARLMKQEGFVRFEELIDDFRDKFNDKWLKS
ncbi:hypothetical protein [Yeosuana marina]|uniref:hypothetical protein n=1 Tax=Yeosuana marina TaxID=1565536 RepID=UPI0030C7F5AD